jgi:hypothetical protein
VLKLGIAAAAFTWAASAERFTLEDELLEELGLVLGDEEEELAGVLAGALLLELLELLDEHAASNSATPAAASPYAMRDARGLRLPSLKRFMRPRICHTGGLDLDAAIRDAAAARPHLDKRLCIPRPPASALDSKT